MAYPRQRHQSEVAPHGFPGVIERLVNMGSVFQIMNEDKQRPFAPTPYAISSRLLLATLCRFPLQDQARPNTMQGEQTLAQY